MNETNCIQLGSTREVCWDMYFVEESEGVTLTMHKPVRKNVVLNCDAPWEGSHCGYISLLKVGDVFRMYYRAEELSLASKLETEKKKDGPDFTGSTKAYAVSICMAESKDGKTFTRPSLCKFEIFGEKDNNIIFRDEEEYIDNFSIFYDENPDCPPDEKFKALRYTEGPEENALMYYKSADGLDFTYDRILPVPGKFDTFNVTLWDKKTEQYFLYYRDYHKADGRTTPRCEVDVVHDIRDVRVATSKDFKTWELHGRIDFGPNAEDIPLYVNGITKYFRSENIFWGLPVRYNDRVADKHNFKALTLPGFNRYESIEKLGREATVVTDAVLITSRDGLRFDRTDEGFATPGPEDGGNWRYGDCYHAYGAFETASDFPGEANEMSIYSGKGNASQPIAITRYTLRLDGFFSWNAAYSGGYVLTKPFTFAGNSLSVNFATSAMGHVRILVCDEAGNPIPGYDSGKVFGNSIDRTVGFEEDLSKLAGMPVRLRFEMKDCELYSFVFVN